MKNGWIYLSFSETLPGYKAPEPEPAAAAAAAGRGGPPSPPSMTVIVRGKIRDNAWVDQQVIFRGAPELYSPANFHYGSRFIFDRQGHLFYSIGDKGEVESAQDLSHATGKDPSRQRRWLGAERQSVRENAWSCRVDLELRASQPARVRVGSR